VIEMSPLQKRARVAADNESARQRDLGTWRVVQFSIPKTGALSVPVETAAA
jgi:hypothetical protein